MRRWFLTACLVGCSSGNTARAPVDGGALDLAESPDDLSAPSPLDGGIDAGAHDAARFMCAQADAGSCYLLACEAPPHSLQENRDRLIADLAQRKCTDSCTLWAALNQSERYIFLMDTAYLAAAQSRIYPPGSSDFETALDHAVALYSINSAKAGQGVDGSGRGGNDYNRIYLGFDALATCVMRNFSQANPGNDPAFNQWQKSDDVAGPHAPFTQREMIFWYKAFTDLQSNGPQFHHWAKDADFDQSGLNQRLGVCGVTDRSLTELTIAFDFYHSSDPLGDYAGRGGFGWQIVDQHIDINADWNYSPASCAVSAPVNTDPYGGGTFSGMGPSLNGSACTPPGLNDGGSC